MIDKIYAGKKIAACRKKKNLTQAELAERVGISPQGVSKWETGSALPDIDILMRLSELFDVTVNELLEETELFRRATTDSYKMEDGIALFDRIVFNEPEWMNWETDMKEESWIKRNWKTALGLKGGWSDSDRGENPLSMKRRESDLKVGHEIAKAGGVILEIGAGPGGGYMPFVLQADPLANIIINDLSKTVLSEWKQLLNREVDSPNLHFAAFDFCKIPLKDGSIDVVADHGGIINCIGNRAAALREAYRVLKPGGMLVSDNGFVTKEELDRIPLRAKEEMLREYPDIVDDLYQETVLAGFHRIDSEITGTWTTEEDNDSGIAKLAEDLGISVKFTQYVRYCMK